MITENLLASAVVVNASIEVDRLRAEIVALEAELKVQKEAREILFCERGALKAEVNRLKRDYAVFEELSPPDMPREIFAKWCFDAYDKDVEQGQQIGALKSEVERLRKAMGECRDEFVQREQGGSPLFFRSNVEMKNVCRAALGEVGKKEE